MTKENKNKTIAVSVTVAIHALVVVLLVILALTTPLPLPGEAGVEVNLGMYDEGMGNQQQPKPTEAVQPSAPQPEPEKVKEDIVTQETEETESISEQKPENTESVIDPKTLFHYVEPQNQPQESEGNTDIQGNQGSNNGNDETTNTTTPGGDGINPDYDLKGRGALGDLPIPNINPETAQQGTRVVVIDIWVDRNGFVKKAEINYKKTTANSNSIEREKAREAAYSSRFTSANEDVPELQQGTITYTYVNKK